MFSRGSRCYAGMYSCIKVRVKPKNRSSSVMKASYNLETISFIRSKLESKMVTHLYDALSLATLLG